MTIVMRIIRASETYSVDENGFIGRPKIGMLPSTGRQFVGIARGNNFGTIERVSFKQLCDPDTLASINWKFNSGKPRWFGCDINHGTYREWGSPNDLQRVEMA